MFLKVIFIYWPLLAIIIAAALSRLIHNAKVADRALEAQQFSNVIAEQF